MNDRKKIVKDFATSRLKKRINFLLISLLLFSLSFVLIAHINAIIYLIGEDYSSLIVSVSSLLLLGPATILILFASDYILFYFTGKGFGIKNVEIEKKYYQTVNYDTMLKMVRKYCQMNEYKYEYNLNTLIYDEKFTVFTKKDASKNTVVNEDKIGVYYCEQYSAEYKHAYKGYKVCNSSFGEAKFFKGMFCDNDLYKYGHNSEYVNVNSIIIVVVDRMNSTLYKILTGVYKEKYALFAVICLDNPNEILISQDNRWISGDDYTNKKEELYRILNIGL